MSGSDLSAWDAPTIAAAVQSKRTDPVEVIDAFLGQIRRANPAVNALVDHDEAAPRAEAAAVRAALDAPIATLLRSGLAVAETDTEWSPYTTDARILAIEDVGPVDLLGV